MRLRLIIFTSLLAAIAGAGASAAVVFALFASLRPFQSPGLLVASTFVLPAASIVAAAFFVYRHTARRRKLQALATALLATSLSFCLLIVAVLVSSRREAIRPPQPIGPAAAN